MHKIDTNPPSQHHFRQVAPLFPKEIVNPTEKA